MPSQTFNEFSNFTSEEPENQSKTSVYSVKTWWQTITLRHGFYCIKKQARRRLKYRYSDSRHGSFYCNVLKRLPIIFSWFCARNASLA